MSTSIPDPTRAPSPVTALHGLPGAGRTSLARHLVATLGAQVHVVASCAAIGERGDAAVVVVDEPGVVTPQQTLHAFVSGHGHAPVVSPQVARLDTRVTVVDASRIEAQIVGGAEVVAGRTIAEIAVAQIEQADVVVVNRVDLVTDAQLERVRSVIAALNPTALCVSCAHGQVAPELVVDTAAFVLDASARAPGWLQAVRRWDEDASRSAVDVFAVGEVDVLVYRAWRPFVPSRLRSLLEAPRAGVLRVRGWCWLANVPDRVLALSGAGPALELRPLGRWWATRHPIYWPADGPRRASLDRRWREPHGDRRQEIVWSGVDLDVSGIQKGLDESLVPDADMSAGFVRWQNLEQVFVPMPWRHVSAVR